MKESGRLMSTIVHLFFLSNFNKTLFALNNEPFLREITIQKYIYNTPPNILYKSVITMLKSNHFTRKLVINEEVSKDLIVDIFKPFLYYYYIINYDIQGTQKISSYKNILYLKLKKFYEYNKSFGRKIMHPKPRKSNGNSISFKIKQRDWVPFSFNTKHISFHNIVLNETDTNDVFFMFYITQGETIAADEDSEEDFTVADEEDYDDDSTVDDEVDSVS
jgi:hypothetical protein